MNFTENGIRDSDGNVAIYNYEWNRTWAWISPDDLFVRFLTQDEQDEIVDHEIESWSHA